MVKMLNTRLLPMILMFAMLVSVVYATDNADNGSGKRPVIIDVRTEAEWTAGHLEGAVLIPYERIGDEIAKVVADKDEKIYLYCRTGRRTGIAAETLKKAGYEKLINLQTVENASKVLHREIIF
jgi:phage shock protein E